MEKNIKVIFLRTVHVENRGVKKNIQWEPVYYMYIVSAYCFFLPYLFLVYHTALCMDILALDSCSDA